MLLALPGAGHLCLALSTWKVTEQPYRSYFSLSAEADETSAITSSSTGKPLGPVSHVVSWKGLVFLPSSTALPAHLW